MLLEYPCGLLGGGCEQIFDALWGRAHFLWYFKGCEQIFDSERSSFFSGASHNKLK